MIYLSMVNLSNLPILIQNVLPNHQLMVQPFQPLPMLQKKMSTKQLMLLGKPSKHGKIQPQLKEVKS
jgi:hypothetical protein